MNSSSTAAGVGHRPPFTASQWQELEHQALIFKYMMAGVPVPHELLLPIRRSFEAAMASRFYYHPALSVGYCSLYGKKLDPEPGRCRRTDGKKWRCSKDAYADSKYCERHMHRGRNRSRKPVETQLTTTTHSSSSSSSSSSSTLTALAPTTTSASSGSFQSFPLHSVTGGGHVGAGSSQLRMDTGSYGLGSRDFRYPYGFKAEADAPSLFSEASGSAKSLGMDSSIDSTWRLMPAHVSSYPILKESAGSLLQSNYPQLNTMQDFGQVTISSLPKPQQQQQQHTFFGSEFGSSEPVKHEGHSLRPFFDEWPKNRDSWSDLDDDRSNPTSFSTTQLSMSIPMASSDFSTTSSRSPNDD